ncbi:MAG: hypothetical protein ACREUS_08950 [Burkholderiales bacterium]
MRSRIEFRFKGERTYIQGPDMVDAAMREVMAAQMTARVSNLVFVMNRMTARNLDLILDDEAPPEATPVARLSFEARGVTRRGILVERADGPAERLGYDERELRARCRIDAGTRAIVLQGSSPFSAVETLVAMTKALHLALYPDNPGQWLFGQLEAPCWPLVAVGEGVEIRLVQAVGTRLTKSAARLRGETFAWIYFSLKERA